MIQKAQLYFFKQFSLDTRALSLMRICLGIVLIIDWIIRLDSLTAHYTNEGVLPTTILYAHNWKDGYYSLFLLSDNIYWQYLLVGIALLFSFFFLIGYFTRFSTLIVWILLLSIHVRNPFILQGGDELLRISLFWFLFLPLGNHFSVDSLNKLKHEQTRVLNAASIGFMLLVFSVYFFSALLKTSLEWRAEGSALYYALSLDQMVLPLGKILLNYPSLLKGITLSVFWLEIIAPLLFFLPFKNNYFRAVGIIALILFHIGISFTLFVGLFYLIGISTLVGLLSTENINWLSKKIPTFIKNYKLVCRFNSILPSFSAVRNLGINIKEYLSNFYTKTIINFLLIFISCICIIWNLGNIKKTNLSVSPAFKKMAYALGLHQDWGMFAPSVFKDDGWYVLDGRTSDNKQIDIYKNGLPTKLEKPENILDYIKDDRWRKYEENYIMVDYQYIRPFYCNYLLKNWNKNHSNKIDSLTIIYMKERTLPNYQKSTATKEVLCTCKLK